MNIFYLDPDPVKCASYHCDKHMKMLLETVQILSAVYWLVDPTSGHVKHFVGLIYEAPKGNPKPAAWARQSLQHFQWLVELGFALSDEYTKRYGKVHASSTYLNWMSQNPPALEDVGFSPPPQCMPEQYQQEDTVEAYRTFYLLDKFRFAKWAHSEQPDWWTL